MVIDGLVDIEPATQVMVVCRSKDTLDSRILATEPV
jgi:hypothetical protein